MSTFTRSNEEAILAAITGDLVAKGFKVRCELGEEEDARRGAPPRIVWVPSRRGGRRYTHPAQQLLGQKVAHEKNVQFDVHVWGANYVEVSCLEDALIAALFNQLSPNAYELLEASLADEPEKPGEGRGYELVIPVRLLRVPITAEWRSRNTPITITTVTGEVAGALGEAPASAASGISVTYS